METTALRRLSERVSGTNKNLGGMKMKLFEKAICCAIIAASVFGLFACKSTQVNENKGEITIFAINGNYFEGGKKDSVWKKLEEECGATINITGAVNNGDYYNTLNPKINTAKNMPDVFFSCPDATEGSYFDWGDQQTGVLYNLDDLLAGREKEFPYLAHVINSEQFGNIKYGGAHTLMMAPSERSGWGIYYRADWLVAVGYYQKDGNGNAITDENGNKIPYTPQTMDELTEVLGLFSENDPDGNGKKDTYGISPGAHAHFMNPFYHAFGVPTDWDYTGEKVDYMYCTPEYKNFLNWFRAQYRAGYVDPLFYQNRNDSDRKRFEEGKVGIMVTNAGATVASVAKKVEDLFGEGSVVMGKPPVGTAECGVEGCGGFSDWGGWWGGFSISRSCKNTDAVLKLFNYINSPEGSMLCNFGIEGVHYTMENGKVKPNLEARGAEPDGTFAALTDETGGLDYYGKHRFSTILLSVPMIWNLETDEYELVPQFESVDLKYADLMQQAFDNVTLSVTRLVNVTDYSGAVLKKRNKIQDICETYAVQAMADKKNTTTDWDKMISDCNANGMDSIRQIFKNKGISLGLISA